MSTPERHAPNTITIRITDNPQGTIGLAVSSARSFHPENPVTPAEVFGRDLLRFGAGQITGEAYAQSEERLTFELLESSESRQLWLSDTYHVEVGGMLQRDTLHIARRDGLAARDWRDLQSIKNQFLGPEACAVEIFPPQSRYRDHHNVLTLWSVPARSLPGINELCEHVDEAEAFSARLGRSQRPFDDVHRHLNLKTPAGPRPDHQ